MRKRFSAAWSWESRDAPEKLIHVSMPAYCFGIYPARSVLLNHKISVMNFNGLTPDQIKLIFNLSKRIETLESRLGRLQDKVVRVDSVLTADLARNFKYISLN